MPIPGPAPGMTPTPGPPGGPGAPGSPGTPDVTGPGNRSAGPGGPADPNAVPFGDRLAAMAPGTAAIDPSKVNLGDLFNTNGMDDVLRSLRTEMNEAMLQKDLSSRESRMWRMLDLQMRAQHVAMRVELATKLVEHGTGSIKQISQTQA